MVTTRHVPSRALCRFLSRFFDPVPLATAASWIKDLQRNLWVSWLRHYYSGGFDLKWPTHSLTSRLNSPLNPQY
ncbi:hypothetical protein VN97_g9471 [Penicillium thymicola]|uniref:Uncharacterized protein n=1 Tax=Penicillium thymicola TaxID=293382 RepID=A0AAI9TBX1_PENTH|nr:hypothetical protein VN97_g9471 [Penicillium thymicola]